MENKTQENGVEKNNRMIADVEIGGIWIDCVGRNVEVINIDLTSKEVRFECKKIYNNALCYRSRSDLKQLVSKPPTPPFALL